ncbi:hypothetical protein Tco_1317209 [Tanacetum coccineum]
MKTPMSSDTKLMKDEECESVDSTKYRGMIGSLLYLTASRPDIMFSVCLCARFQEAPKTSHLEAVKRIFRYIKGTTHLGLWYPKGTGTLGFWYNAEIVRITIYGSHLLILSAYAPSMPPLLSLPLSMACDDSDGCHDNVFAAMAAQSLFYPGANSFYTSQAMVQFKPFLFHEKSILAWAARAQWMLGKTYRGENEDVDLHLAALLNTNMGCDESSAKRS